MLKKVSVEQLHVGMFINSFYCSWFKHPFALSKFLLKNSVEINKIRTASIEFVEIDITKGLDILVEKKSLINQNLKLKLKKV